MNMKQEDIDKKERLRVILQPNHLTSNEIVTTQHQSFETPEPPTLRLGDHQSNAGPFHFITTPFLFPGIGGHTLKSRSSTLTPGNKRGSHPVVNVFIFVPRSISFEHVFIASCS